MAFQRIGWSKSEPGMPGSTGLKDHALMHYAGDPPINVDLEGSSELVKYE
jgi:hypothetical protein